MKTSISYSLIAAAMACGLANAQTAYTIPVGYISLDVPANADTTINAPLQRPTSYAGASTSIAGNVVGATGLVASGFVTPACYLKITSGSLAGNTFPIVSNTTSSITVLSGAVSLQALGFVAGNTFDVIPFWTLNTLFPAGAGVGGTSDALNPTSYVLVSDYVGIGADRASGQAFIYCTGDAELGLVAGWYDNADPFSGTKNDVPIDPSIQYTIRAVNSATVTISGQVPSTNAATEVVKAAVTNDNYLATPFPVDISLSQSGLQSVIAATSDALNPTEYVFTYNNTATGYNKSAGAAYFYCSGDAELGLAAGWYDNADPFSGIVTGNVLQAGRCFILRKSPSTLGTLDWTSPLPYSL